MLCKPGDESICPNYLYGTMTGTFGGRKMLSCLEVERMLRQMGVDPEKCSRCVMTGIQCGAIEVTGQPEELDKVIFMGRGELCDCKIPVKLGDALFQADSGGADFEKFKGETTKAKIFCHRCRESDDEYGHFYFLSYICRNNPDLNSGKYHKHCTECPGYGECIGDYRETHCPHCGGHGRRGWCYTEGCPNEFMPSDEESKNFFSTEEDYDEEETHEVEKIMRELYGSDYDEDDSEDYEEEEAVVKNDGDAKADPKTAAKPVASEGMEAEV